MRERCKVSLSGLSFWFLTEVVEGVETKRRDGLVWGNEGSQEVVFSVYCNMEPYSIIYMLKSIC